jgi:hypothetical protein
MVWIAAIVVLLLFVFVPGFRLFVIAATVLGAITIFVMNQKEQRDRARLRRLITQNEVEFVDFRMGSSSYGSREIFGRIRNNSQRFGLHSIGVTIFVQDCSSEPPIQKPKCEIVAQKDETIYVNAPAQQVRDFRESLYFPSDMKIRGKMEWYYRLDFIEAGES